MATSPFTHANLLRRIYLRPYLKGIGPTFTLTTYDAGTRNGRNRVAYRLQQSNVKLPVFEGADFGCSPLHAIDSNDTVKGILAFLTLRIGDTDREYFASYTEAQYAFASEHAESLAAHVFTRFGE